MTIKPCPNPFCLGEGIAMQLPGIREWKTVCSKCFIGTGYFATEAEAIAAWNNRPGELEWIKIEEGTPLPRYPTPCIVFFNGNIFSVVMEDDGFFNKFTSYWTVKKDLIGSYYIPLSSLLKTLPK